MVNFPCESRPIMNRYDFLEADEWFWTMFKPTLNWQNFTFGQLFMQTGVINNQIWLLRGYMSDFEQCSKRIQIDLIHLKWWEIWTSKMTACVLLWNKSKKRKLRIAPKWWEIQLEMVRNTAQNGCTGHYISQFTWNHMQISPELKFDQVWTFLKIILLSSIESHQVINCPASQEKVTKN